MAIESTRDALVRAGVELLESTGSTDVGLREIARRAGVSHGAPRRWFPTHRALLSAIAEVGLRDLATDVMGAAGGEHGRIVIERAARAYVRFAVDRPAMFTLVFRHDLLDGGGSDLRSVSRPLMDWLRGHLDIDDAVERDLRGAALWTSVHGVAVLASTGALTLISPHTSADDLIDAAVRATHLDGSD